MIVTGTVTLSTFDQAALVVLFLTGMGLALRLGFLLGRWRR